MAVGINKAGTQRTSVELGGGKRVELLPLLNAQNASRVINRNDGAWHNLASINEIVCCDVAHNYLRAPSSMARISESEKMRTPLCSLNNISTHSSVGGVWVTFTSCIFIRVVVFCLRSAK